MGIENRPTSQRPSVQPESLGSGSPKPPDRNRYNGKISTSPAAMDTLKARGKLKPASGNRSRSQRRPTFKPSAKDMKNLNRMQVRVNKARVALDKMETTSLRFKALESSRPPARQDTTTQRTGGNFTNFLSNLKTKVVNFVSNLFKGATQVDNSRLSFRENLVLEPGGVGENLRPTGGNFDDNYPGLDSESGEFTAGDLTGMTEGTGELKSLRELGLKVSGADLVMEPGGEVGENLRPTGGNFDGNYQRLDSELSALSATETTGTGDDFKYGEVQLTDVDLGEVNLDELGELDLDELGLDDELNLLELDKKLKDVPNSTARYGLKIDSKLFDDLSDEMMSVAEINNILK